MGFRQPGFCTENGEGESRGEPWEPGELKAAGPSAPGSSTGKGRGSQELGVWPWAGSGLGKTQEGGGTGDAPGVAGRRSSRAGAVRGLRGKVTSARSRAVPA